MDKTGVVKDNKNHKCGNCHGTGKKDDTKTASEDNKCPVCKGANC